MALMHRVNENGRIEAVRLISTTNPNKTDGYYVLETSIEGSLNQVPPKLIPVTIVPTGQVFLGEPSLRYVNDIVDHWQRSFIPKLPPVHEG